MSKYSFLDKLPTVYDPHLYGGYNVHQDEPELLPESSRMVEGTEYLTVAEFIRRISPDKYPVVEDLISESGVDRTYMVLGTMAATSGRAFRVEPQKMFHPQFETVNGWPMMVLQDAWRRFQARYDIEWRTRDPIEPKVPAPVEMPPLPYSTKLLDQLRDTLRRRGVDLPVTRDPRWQGAYSMLTGTREDRQETPEQAMVRRQSAAAALYVVEKEYEGR